MTVAIDNNGHTNKLIQSTTIQSCPETELGYSCLPAAQHTHSPGIILILERAGEKTRLREDAFSAQTRPELMRYLQRLAF